MTWHTTRLPTAADADLFGMVRWGPTHPGLLCRWDEVREGEAWSHSSAWKQADALRDAMEFMDEYDDVFRELAR